MTARSRITAILARAIMRLNPGIEVALVDPAEPLTDPGEMAIEFEPDFDGHPDVDAEAVARIIKRAGEPYYLVHAITSIRAGSLVVVDVDDSTAAEWVREGYPIPGEPKGE